MHINAIDLEKGMDDACDGNGLTREQQYRKVIQELLRIIGKLSNDDAAAAILPHAFLEPDFLECRQDGLGNLLLTTTKHAALDADAPR